MKPPPMETFLDYWKLHVLIGVTLLGIIVTVVFNNATSAWSGLPLYSRAALFIQGAILYGLWRGSQAALYAFIFLALLTLAAGVKALSGGATAPALAAVGIRAAILALAFLSKPDIDARFAERLDREGQQA